MSLNTSGPALHPAPAFSAREVLRLAWPLFQETLLRCLPLAVLAAAASAVPQAESVARKAQGLASYDAQWWGVAMASTVLVLICYDSVLRLQWASAIRQPSSVLPVMRLAVAALPGTLLLILLALTPLLPPTLWIGLRGFGVVGVLLLLAGLLGVMFVFFGWTAMLGERLLPWAALRRSIVLVRAQFAQVAALLGLLLAMVLVFSMLSGIFIDVVMMLAGPQAQSSHGWQALSRWLMAGVLAIPIIYISAVSVTAFRMVTATERAA
jgi:hypothetical protein